MVDTIAYNFGVKIDNYVVADFEMFQVLVDAIGGVEVKVTKAEAKEVTGHPKRYGNVKLKAGKHNLTGKQAWPTAAFARSTRTLCAPSASAR